MNRQFIALLLLPCIVFPYAWAAFHSHAGVAASDHSARPHIHVGHDHGENSNHEHHHGATSDRDGVPQRQSSSPDDHGADAVFVEFWSVARESRAAVIERGDASGVFRATSIDLSMRYDIQSSCSHLHEPSLFDGRSCPLYLRQRTLRI